VVVIRRLCCVVVVLAVAGVAIGSLGAVAGEKVERSKAVPVRVELTDRETDLRRFGELGLDVDGVFGGWARIYATPGERDALAGLGYSVTLLPDEGRIGLERLADEGVASGVVTAVPPTQYHNYDTLTSDLQAVAAAYPDITRLTSIGQSYQGRELWMMKITSDPDVESTKPEVEGTGLQPDQLPDGQLRHRLAGHEPGGQHRDLHHAVDEPGRHRAGPAVQRPGRRSEPGLPRSVL
jgi:hypothetical protein